MPDSAKANELKQAGNVATAAGNFDEAARLYSEAIEADPSNHVLWSNRSASYANLGEYEKALTDAEKAIECKPDWAKGYSRKGLALAYLQRHEEAIKTYEEGVRLDPSSAALKEGLQDARAAKAKEQGGAFPNPFSDPMMIPKLAANPKTRHLVDDVEFMTKLKLVQANPQMLSTCLQDPRMMLALSTMMGVDLHNGGGSPPQARRPTPTQKATPPPEKMDVEQGSPEVQQAKEEKKLGTEAYKKKDFETALSHYTKAAELDPTDMVYILNQAAVRMEQEELDKCIELSLKAVEVGRENRADFKLIAKALARCASAYVKQENYEKAKLYYEKSLSEHRLPETRTKLSEVEKKVKEMRETAYLDEAKAEEERERGNELFKEGKYSDAVKVYTEAIKRNPESPKIYSNRAGAYTKLAAFDLAVRDCDKCIKLDPKFIKGFIRKGYALKGMMQLDNAMDAFQKATEIDENCQEAIAGYRECMVAADADPEHIKKRAMRDPEVAQILSDPGMRLILEQMQSDPDAAKEHLTNADVARKIQKLVSCGLIAFR